MIATTARIHTPLAARYLTQLCKHFEHKLPVTHGNGAGSIAFSSGVCTLAADDASLAQITDVVSRHLVRFAFREPLSVEWSAA
jgi:hypothetical protein